MDRNELLVHWNVRRNQTIWERFPRWLRWRVTKKIAKWSGHPKRTETELFWGQAMTIVYPEFVSSKIGHDGFFEPDVTSMFIDVLRPGMRIYDVGSHFGYFSLLASEIVGDSGHVFALEPTANTYDVLCENAARQQNITCNQLAAFRETCEITFLDQGLHDSSLNYIVNEDIVNEGHDLENSGQRIRIPAVKLDDFAAEHGDPDFLKIDAEGAERPILEGMIELIERSHPGISLELGDQICEKTGSNPCRDNIQFLLDLGYEVFDYRNLVSTPHPLASHYKYANLFFRHPAWDFMQSEIAKAA